MQLDKIKSLAEKKGISIRDLSEKINLTAEGIYQNIRKNSIKAETLEKIAELLEVPVSYFFDDKMSEALTNGHTVVNHKGSVKISQNNTTFDDCKKEVDALKKEIEYLKEINNLLKDQLKKN